jgi:tetratricopeptide (TPR) repeat protein
VLGLAYYRAGQFQEAVQKLSWSARQTWRSRAIYYPVLALARHRLGHAGAAWLALDSAATAIDKWTATLATGRVGNLPIPWVDWLECQLLYREAHLLLTGSPPREEPRLKSARDRALLALTEDAPSVWLERARTLATQGKEEEAGVAFCKVLAQTPTEYWHRSECSLLCAEIVQWPKAFAKAVTLRPQDARLWIASGRAHARKRRWKEAAAAYARAVPALPPNDHVWYEHAGVLLLGGDTDGYRRFCKQCIEQVERSGQIAEPTTAHALARLCALAPGGGDPAQLVRWAELPLARGPRQSWYLHALAAAQYRAGQFEQAERTFQESLKGAWPGYPMSLIFLALAYHKLSLAGNPAYAKGARDLVEKTDKWLDDVSHVLDREGAGFPQAVYPADWLIVQVLRREAATLMGDKQKLPGK